MNDQTHGDGRRIQPPPGWPGASPPADERPPGEQPRPAPQSHPAPGQPAPDYGPPGQYFQPYHQQPYHQQPYHQQYGQQPYQQQPYHQQPYQQQYGQQQPYQQQYGQQQYGTGGYGAPPPPPRKRRGLGTVLVLVVLAALGGGGYLAYRSGVLAPVLGPLLGGSSAAPAAPAPDPTVEPVTPDVADEPAAPDAPGGGGFGDAQPGLSTTVPGCPFTADQVGSMVGQSMVDKGTCLFGDGKGVAQLGIEVHSASSTAATLDYARARANQQYLLVEDLKNGDKGYLAYKNTSAEAMTVTPQGGYTITMSGFERFNGFTYEEPLTAVISALPR